MVSEEQHKLLSVERRNRFKAAVGGPDSPAGNSVDTGMKVKVISVALNGDDDARQGGRVGGDFPKYLLEGLPGGFAERPVSSLLCRSAKISRMPKETCNWPQSFR